MNDRITEVTPTEKPNTDSDTKQIVEALSRAGAAWARYGLGVARMSVQASATTLEATATALGTLSEKFAELADETRQHNS